MKSYLKEKNLGGRQIQFSCQIKEILNTYLRIKWNENEMKWICANQNQNQNQIK